MKKASSTSTPFVSMPKVPTPTFDASWQEEHDRSLEIAQRAGVRFAEAEELFALAQLELYAAVPKRFLAANHVLPVARRGSTVIVAVTDPAVQLPELAAALSCSDIEPWVVTPTDLRRLRLAFALGQVGEGGAAGSSNPAVRDLLDEEELKEPQLGALFDEILLDAIGERASDIHLERYGDQVRLRLRTDGNLRDVRHFHLRPEQLEGLLNIIKVRATLDLAERRSPQGGRFTISAGERVFDLRVQTQPSHYGEHAVIRLLPRDLELLTIEQLGFTDELAATYRRLLQAPSGLLLAVGPSGCGKSTTLYSGLQLLAGDASRKVITVEDPIEYAVKGVQQTQVHSEVNFTFGTAMRTFVREDPDVIFLGEIRDTESAQESLRASQTGHLVLTTLHAGDSVDAIQRLFDLGMHPNSVASEFLGAFGQRLSRRICPRCRVEATLDPRLVTDVFPHGVPDGFRAYRGKGCAHCRWSGTLGRTAVVEFLPTSSGLRRGIARQLPLDELRVEALAAGFVPMREHALTLIREGVMPFDELAQLLPQERLRPEP